MMISPEHARILLYTKTREAFIRLFETLALGIDPAFLHDRRGPPVIVIQGGYKSGKGLAVEVMMKAWSDAHTVEDIHEQPKNAGMFMERFRAHALFGLSDIFRVVGRPVRLTFTHGPLYERDIKRPLRRIMRDSTVEGGAMFFTTGVLREERFPYASLSAEVHPFGDDASDWRRSVIFSVHDDALWRSPQFQLAWHALFEQSASKNPANVFDRLTF